MLLNICEDLVIQFSPFVLLPAGNFVSVVQITIIYMVVSGIGNRVSVYLS